MNTGKGSAKRMTLPWKLKLGYGISFLSFAARQKVNNEQLFFPSRILPHFPLYKLNTRICISRDLGVGEQEWEMEVLLSDNLNSRI